MSTLKKDTLKKKKRSRHRFYGRRLCYLQGRAQFWLPRLESLGEHIKSGRWGMCSSLHMWGAWAVTLLSSRELTTARGGERGTSVRCVAQRGGRRGSPRGPAPRRPLSGRGGWRVPWVSGRAGLAARALERSAPSGGLSWWGVAGRVPGLVWSPGELLP